MQQLKQVQLSMTRQIQQIIKQQRKRLDYLASYYKFKTPSLLYDQQIQRRDELEKQLNLNLKMQLTQARQDLRLLAQKFNLRYLLNDIKQYQSHAARYQQVLVQRLRQMLSHNETQLKNKVELLNNLSPTNVMLRGYSIISKDDQVVTSVDQISKGDQLNLAMKDGNIKASVEKVGKMMSEEKQSFEEMMKELESIVNKLDNETVSLEESLDLYQRGMKLSASCNETLKTQKRKSMNLSKTKRQIMKVIITMNQQMTDYINLINSRLQKQ